MQGQSLCPLRWGSTSRSGLGGGFIGEHLRKVLVRKQGVAQAKFLRHCLVEVNRHVAKGSCGSSIEVGRCQEAIATWVHLPGTCPWASWTGQLSGIQVDGPVAGAFVKNILFWTRWMIDVL